MKKVNFAAKDGIKARPPAFSGDDEDVSLPRMQSRQVPLVLWRGREAKTFLSALNSQPAAQPAPRVRQERTAAGW